LDARIPKLRAEAARLKMRIENLTTRYNATIDKVTELENLEIVGLVRAENMSIEQLAALIKGGVPDED
jgi:N-acetylneuraminic acid mutarotase